MASFANLYYAWRKAMRGSGGSEEALKFTFFLEENLLRLSEELLSGQWRPDPYRYFPIWRPKHRIISAASFRDRVVHHAIIRVLEPIYERVFIHHSYATRKGKGVHKARAQAQAYVRAYAWFLKSDVEKYFERIDHDCLLRILARKIKDQAAVGLLEEIIRHGGHAGKGLPIGNLTSQFLANVYLDPLDHYIQDSAAAPGYIRYMDDFVLFSDDRYILKAWLGDIRIYLQDELRISLKESATYLNQRANGLSFLAGRIYPSLMRVHRANLRRAMAGVRHRERRYLQGKLDEAGLSASMNSYAAYLESFDTAGLRRKLFAYEPDNLYL
ncbi:MAG: reverse transcriptase/maturase family protein [Bacteroidia bacterium]|nr:reverse transcriptase/maturase family protein [Bacteroidia bacterium]